MEDIFHEPIEPYARQVGLFKASSEKAAGDGPEGEGEGGVEGGGSRRRKLRHTPVGLFIVTRTYGDRFRN